MLQGFNISPSSPDNFWGKAGGNLANSKRPARSPAIQRMVRLWTNTSPNAGLQYCSDAGFRDLTEFLPVWHPDWNHARTKVYPETTACGPASKPFGILRLQLLVLDHLQITLTCLFGRTPGHFFGPHSISPRTHQFGLVWLQLRFRESCGVSCWSSNMAGHHDARAGSGP